MVQIQPRIVVLDGHTLNPGALSWGGLESMGIVTVHPRTSPAEVVDRCEGAELIVTNKVPLASATLVKLPAARYIGVLATGFNVVDVAAARQQGITVSNVPSYGTTSVSQHVFALLLELTQRTGHHAQTVRQGRWTVNPDWCYWDSPLVELDGLTLGVVGAGRIGQAVGRIARAFGMTVHFATRTGGRFELERVLRASDVVSLHCPLSEETRGLINHETLGWLKPTAFLLNTGRGPLIDESALADALNSGRLAGAGLDVVSKEPPSDGSPLFSARNCVVTPHLAWATTAARGRLLKIAVENISAFLRGSPQNVVS